MNTIIRYHRQNQKSSGSVSGGDFWRDEDGLVWKDEDGNGYLFLAMNFSEIAALPADPSPRRIYAEDRGDFYDIRAGQTGAQAMKNVTSERIEEVTRISSDLQLTREHRSIFGDLTVGNILVTLPPDPAAYRGKMYFIKLSSGDGSLLVDPAPSTLDGSSTPWELNDLGQAVVIQSDGYEWKVVANFAS